MRVLYDGQAFLQRYGGISRYFVDLIRALQAFPYFHPILPKFFSDNEYLPSKRTLLSGRHVPGKVRVMRRMNMAITRRSMGRQHDLLHPTYFHPYFVRSLRRPFVITVHDMIHDIFPPAGVRDDGTRSWTRELCNKAAMVIAVSTNTKHDLCRLTDVPEDKVAVIRHATDLRYQGEPRLHDRPYLLYVGERAGYKNFPFFLDSISRVLHQANLDLVCAGGPSFSPAEGAQVLRLGLEKRVSHVTLRSRHDAASLYRFAQAFCLPSLHEGFGIPVLEAFACGCPVVASACAALPETAGEAAEYFCPIYPESICRSVERVLEPSRTEELRCLGTERVQRYSWQRAAQQTLEVYRKAVSAA